jgi:hypothetical protein
MGDWYWWGLAAGVGTGIGLLAAGVLGRSRLGAAAAPVLAAAAGLGVGLAIGEWDEAAACALGAVLGALGTAPFSRRSVEAGGTRGGTALLLGVAALAVAALALVPALGYLVAVVVPVLGGRLSTRAPKRYAGLRTLAR